MEEMLDNGYPMTTEPNALKAMISPPSVIGRIAQTMSGKSSNVSDVLPDGTISSMPWRKAGVKYTQNEVYFDIIEEVLLAWPPPEPEPEPGPEPEPEPSTKS